MTVHKLPLQILKVSVLPLFDTGFLFLTGFHMKNGRFSGIARVQSLRVGVKIFDLKG